MLPNTKKGGEGEVFSSDFVKVNGRNRLRLCEFPSKNSPLLILMSIERETS